MRETWVLRIDTNLHSTMYLLNLFLSYYSSLSNNSFTFHYVSIKSQSVIIVSPGLSLFTFHYVSIKSLKCWRYRKMLKRFTFHYVSIKSTQFSTLFLIRENLHSTMYLLNLCKLTGIKHDTIIYIPLCIY